jgi:hypothetical protein
MQIFRSGVIESVESMILSRDGSNLIPTFTLEQQIIEHTGRCLNLVQRLGIEVPIYVYITMTGVSGQKLGLDRTRINYDDTPIPVDILNLPEVVFESFEQDVPTILHPAFDLLWQACGIPGSVNYDADGNWTGR